MQAYILIAISAYFAFAVNGIIDKFLLKKGIPNPVALAFYIGMLSGLAILLTPFGFTWPDKAIIVVALISGMAFVYALVALYASLKHASTSRVLPTVGALVPIATLPLSVVFVGESLSGMELAGMIALVLGSLFLAGGARAHSLKHHWLRYAVIAAVLLAVSFALAKVVYNAEPFISGLIWTRIGAVVGALILFFLPATRRMIKTTTGDLSRPTGALFLTGQAIGAAAGILQNYAVALGSVTIVNALQGTQFALLLILTWTLSRWFPRVLREDTTARNLTQKIIAILFICLGLGFIAAAQ